MTSTETLNLNTETAPILELGADLSPAVRAIEVAYRQIQKRYPGTPDATIVVKRDQHVWGHTTVAKTWAPSKLEADKDASHFEIMISGENLRRGAQFVAATLLHESSHAANLAAGTLDTDSNGRHNKAFKAEAENRGLVVTQVGWHGWTGTDRDDRAGSREGCGAGSGEPLAPADSEACRGAGGRGWRGCPGQGRPGRAAAAR